MCVHYTPSVCVPPLTELVAPVALAMLLMLLTLIVLLTLLTLIALLALVVFGTRLTLVVLLTLAAVVDTSHWLSTIPATHALTSPSLVVCLCRDDSERISVLCAIRRLLRRRLVRHDHDGGRLRRSCRSRDVLLDVTLY